MKYLLIFVLLITIVDPNAIYSEEKGALVIVLEDDFQFPELEQLQPIIPATNTSEFAGPSESIDPGWNENREFSDPAFDFPEREFPEAPDYYRFANTPEFETNFAERGN